MKIDFNGIIDLEIPGDDELATVYDKVKATMQKEDTFDLMEAIKERKDGGAGGRDRDFCKLEFNRQNHMECQRGVLHGLCCRDKDSI